MKPLTLKDVQPLSANITGKVVVVKPEELAPQWHNECGQLWLATGGFGCDKNSSGNAVFCTNLFNGQSTRFQRYDLAGEATPEQIMRVEAAKVAAVQGAGI